MRSVTVSGPAVKRAREFAGLKQDDVARKLKVNRATVAGWETDSPANKPGPVNFKALCKLFKVSAAELLADEKAAA